MKKYNPFFYLLFIMLIMGAFASMAQNEYGLKIMGAAGALFGLIFLLELVAFIQKRNENNKLIILEAACLFVLAILFACRLLFIHFFYVEELFAAAGITLAVIYMKRLTDRYSIVRQENQSLAILLAVYHLSIILFLLSLVLMPFASGWAEKGGLIAFVFLVIFLIAVLAKRKYLVEGESVTAFVMVKQYRDHSIIIVSLFLLFTLYVGLNRIGILPGIYSNEYPQEYFKLVDKAASGKEKPLDGKYRHELFKKQYELFLKHHKNGQ